MARGFRVALVAGAGAVACLAAGTALGGIHSRLLHERITAYATVAGFVVLATVAVRRTADGTYRLITLRAGRPGGGMARMLVSLLGYVLVLLVTLGALRIPLGHLLLGGAITGVIVGIAAQQALGNAFAGIVLVLARPFQVGQLIRVRAGALAGEFTGTVRDMSLTYVVLDTDEGRLMVPNSSVLAAAVGPAVPGDDGKAPEPLVLHPREHAALRLPIAKRSRGPRRRPREPRDTP